MLMVGKVLTVEYGFNFIPFKGILNEKANKLLSVGLSIIPSFIVYFLISALKLTDF